jgi:ribonuclease HIII
MKHYTITVEQTELEKLAQAYRNHMVDDENPHIFFHALHNDIHILGYESGKVLLQGNEVSQELIGIKKLLGKIDYEAIGSDEVGTGDVFGPVVVCALYANEEDIVFLESLNVRDSKNMNDRTIAQIAPKIAKKLTHSLLILHPKKYNELTEQGYNLNKMKALLHNQAIIKTASKIGHTVPVIIDQFCTPQLYFNYLKDETLIHRDLNFYTKAESVHISVAAASIVARYAFLVKMHQYSEKLGITLKKGASKAVDDMVMEIYEEQGLEKLKVVTKMNFKNVTKQNIV